MFQGDDQIEILKRRNENEEIEFQHSFEIKSLDRSLIEDFNYTTKLSLGPEAGFSEGQTKIMWH